VIKEHYIERAASLASGRPLRKLYDICYNQKTVSTRKLEKMVDQVADELKESGILIRDLGVMVNEETSR